MSAGDAPGVVGPAARLRVDVGEPSGAGLVAPGQRYRCSVASTGRGESLGATASTVSAYLLLEDPGPWGPAILHCLRVPEAVRARAAAWERDLGVRPLLIRRTGRAGRAGRAGPGPRRVFVVNTRHRWAQTALVEQLDDVADWDLRGATTPEGVGLDAHDEPLLLVCTHGRHDACCAERGRPVARELASRFGELVWESSHLGGDRFAANLLVLPDGDAYGRLDAGLAPQLVADHLAGRIDLTHHRGRGTSSWPAQYAERVVRERLDERGVGAVTGVVLTRTDRQAVVRVTVAPGVVGAAAGAVSDATVGAATDAATDVAVRTATDSAVDAATDAAAGGTAAAPRVYEVVVDLGESEPAQLTCRADAAKPAPTYAPAGLRALPPPRP